MVSSSSSLVGGLIGFDFGNSIVADSYWDTQTSGQATSAGGIGKTTAEMQMQATFDPPWDFTNIWMINEGIDYPRLRVPVLFEDCNSNGIPDECDPDCNANAIPDECDITAGTSLDCNSNTIPDECEGPPCTGILGGDMDCSGTVTLTDLPDFVDSLLAGIFTCNADANGDFAVNGLDAQAFVVLVLP